MKYLIKLIYRCLYKHYFIVLFVFFLIIIVTISLEIIFQSFLNKNKKSIKNTYIIKKHVSYQSSDFINIENNNNNVFYSNILKKQFDLCKNKKLTTVYNYSVLSSDILLTTILKKCSNDTIDINHVEQLIQQYPILRNLKFGQTLSCCVFNQKKIKNLIWQSSTKCIRIYNNINNHFTEGIIRILTESNDGLCYTILFVGELNGTFIDSVRALGLEENCILDVIRALQYQLDFRRLHYKDRFSILVSLNFTSNKKLQSKLIGARLYTAGKDYYIFQLSHGKFYNQEAVYLGNNFIRFPILKPYRISSNFNLNRLNPVTGRVSPHAGVDFAVPIGTPVLAVGDGEVFISKYSKIAGNYISIKHNYQCITRYMHLKKILVKPGQKVKKGDRIGLSGNTGRSTGPHLHFEVWINHHPVNPLTVNIINFDKLLINDRIRFLHQIEEIIPKLSFD